MQISYKLIRSQKRQKSLNLSVTPQGKVIVRAPMHTHQQDIESFVRKNHRWISQRLKNLEQKSVIKAFKTGEEFLYRGQPFLLHLQSEPQRYRTYVSIQDNQLHVKTPLGLRGTIRQQQLRHSLTYWYKKQARAQIEPLVHHYAAQVNKKYNQIRLKDTTSRWGSCSSQGNLNFNWKLILAPHAVLEYVVIHEVCHLVHPHHQRSFWDLVRKYDPNYKTHRRWLKDNGWKLEI